MTEKMIETRVKKLQAIEAQQKELEAATDAIRAELKADLEAPEDLDKLTDGQALAIREQPRLEWLADTLSAGTMAEQMEVFRGRGWIGQLCEKILSNTQMKSAVA